MPNTILYFSYVLQNFHKKKYTYQMLLSSKTKKSFQKWFFLSKLKNIPKGVRSTKCPVATWRKKTERYKTLHIRNYIFRSYFVLIPNNENFLFSVAENELNKLDFGLKLRFLRKIVEGYPICPVNVCSYRRHLDPPLHTKIKVMNSFLIRVAWVSRNTSLFFQVW
jgi:hypothetical protein